MKAFIKRNITILTLLTVITGTLLFGDNKAYAASGDTVVYITKTGKCYHADGCASLSRSKIETTLQQAVNKGLTPCSKCNPPALDANTTAAPASTATKATTTVAANASDQTELTYIGNSNTKKFHNPSCYSASQIKPENRVDFTGTRDEIVAQGYVPCKKCKP